MSKTDSHSTLSDEELASQYRETGEKPLVGELYKRYTSRVYGLCLKYLKDRDSSQDAVMHIFEELMVKMREHEINNFKSWLFTLSRNFCLMQLRKKSVDNYSEEFQDIHMEIPHEMHHTNETRLEDHLEALKKCLETLKIEQRQCVQMFYLEKQSYQQIEHTTAFPLKKVKSHIQNGKRNLKICIEKSV